MGLKLRHLIHRATRAAVLTGLDSATKPSLLQRLMAQVPPAAPFSPDIEGPLARPSHPVLSMDEVLVLHIFKFKVAFGLNCVFCLDK